MEKYYLGEMIYLQDILTEIISLHDYETIMNIVNKNMLQKELPYDISLTVTEYELLGECLENLELLMIDYWNPQVENEKIILKSLSELYIKIVRAMPIPDDDIDKIKHMLKIIIYSYLSEHWESTRRLLKEKEEIFFIDPESDVWNERLLKTIYVAILYLNRKSSWDDLNSAVSYIVKLKKEQRDFEIQYLESIEKDDKNGEVLELAALYHLAKSVELVCLYQLQGEPNDIIEKMNYHFENSIKYAELGQNIELSLLLRMLKPAFEKMIFNSVWRIANRVNSRIKAFVESLIESNKPIIELMYPQRYSILENGLLDPAHKAIVVNLPTSSGKTLIAEFRILQALNQFSEEHGWIAYVAPTRALVNQITIRLKKDLGASPLNIKVEKMSGALEIDYYEKEMIRKQNIFDVLVTTPEKLNLLIRQDIEEQLGRPLVLVVLDEAHNIGNEKRGINIETMLSIIKKDCRLANYLLLTPFITNPDDLAEWLDPDYSKSISLSVHMWRPNDQVIGMYYGQVENGILTTCYKPLVTSNNTLVVDNELIINQGESGVINNTYLNAKYKITSIVASQLFEIQDNILITAYRKSDTYKIADIIFEKIPNIDLSSELILVKKFVSSELGPDFPLVRYLDKGIGIHHAGLPDEIRFLMEYLMEEEQIKYLIATSTIAQGVNFPISTLLMASYSYPRVGKMPTSDFWNLAGRVGRIYSDSPGVIGIALSRNNKTQESIELAEYLQRGTNDLVSSIVQMMERVMIFGDELDLSKLYNVPQWSMFLQYIAHMFNQCNSLQTFISEAELTLRRTYGYRQLDSENKRILLNSVKRYAEKLSTNTGLSKLSDSTGFSPESLQSIIGGVGRVGMTQADWYSSNLFTSDPKKLRQLVGIMLRTPEIRTSLQDIKIRGRAITRSTLAGLITDWVSGKDIIQISNDYFGGTTPALITECVNAIYGKLVLSAAWGLSSFQKMTVSFDELNELELREIQNIPAMIYYGVNTDEAILLRKASVPRSISKTLGEVMLSSFREETYLLSNDEVTSWLNALPDPEWNRSAPIDKPLNGTEYKKIWKILNGQE